MHTDQQNYPEYSSAIFYTNAPRVLSVLWPLLKPFMDPLTVQKVKEKRFKFDVFFLTVLSSSSQVHISSDTNVEGLKRFMPATSIPREYGGSCTTCPGPTCLDWTLGGCFLPTKEHK